MRVNTVRFYLHVERLRHVLRDAAVRVQLIAQHVMRGEWNRAVLEDRLRVLLFVIAVKRVRRRLRRERVPAALPALPRTRLGPR